MARIVVNLSTSKFKAGQDRLLASLGGREQVNIFKKESEVGAPLHTDNPYAFKPYAIQQARKLGYEQVLWLDASMYVLGSLDSVFNEMERTGYFWQDSGWMSARFTTPEQKEYFGTDRGRMVSAGFVGFDFRTKAANDVLDKWLMAASRGVFRGDHSVTRHDQTALSLIIERMGLGMQAGDAYWVYGKPDGQYSENIIAVAEGIC